MKNEYKIDLETDYNTESKNNEIIQIVKAVMCNEWDDKVCPVIQFGIKALTPIKAIEYINENNKDIKIMLNEHCMRIYGKRYKCKYIVVEV